MAGQAAGAASSSAGAGASAGKQASDAWERLMLSFSSRKAQTFCAYNSFIHSGAAAGAAASSAAATATAAAGATAATATTQVVTVVAVTSGAYSTTQGREKGITLNSSCISLLRLFQRSRQQQVLQVS